MVEPDLRTILTTDATLTALVPASKIRLGLVSQGEQGVVVSIYRISGAPGYHMQGSDNLEESRFQIDVRGRDQYGWPGTGYTAAHPAAQRIKELLSGYSGEKGSTDFKSIMLLLERQSSEKPGDELFHKFSMDFQIWSTDAS